MGPSTMDKELATAKIENLEDLYGVKNGLHPSVQVRSLEVTDALVDTAATTPRCPRE